MTAAILLLPIVAGLLLPMLKIKNRTVKLSIVFAVLLIEAGLCTIVSVKGFEPFTLLSMTETLKIGFAVDRISKIFMTIAAYGFLLVGTFAFRYMKHSKNEDLFFCFFLVTEAALMGMDISANLITMYLFFEMITLLSMPLVLHDRTKESIHAALKYLFYSVAGAFLALFCIFVLAQNASTLDFVAGGSVKTASPLVLIATFLGVVGFGAKAGMYPLHAWLPTAHPVAPAPASAVLSAIIAKAGALAIIRIIFYSAGAEVLRGTWVQMTWIGLALLTVFMGSMMAYREKVFKKRLAYSSVSQISYALIGLFMMNPTAVTGGVAHIIFHACIKSCLFVVAGSYIFNTGNEKVDDFNGIGKAMPVTTWAYTFASLALIGIPPASGFISKWYLATGSLDSGITVYSWLAPVMLIISALLTAGYLLPITINGFFPKKDKPLVEKNNEGGAIMMIPIVILSLGTLLMGIFSTPIIKYISEIAEIIAK